MLSYWSGAMAALRLLRCAAWRCHDLIEYKGGLRCSTCNPVRKWRKGSNIPEEVPSV